MNRSAARGLRRSREIETRVRCSLFIHELSRYVRKRVRIHSVLRNPACFGLKRMYKNEKKRFGKIAVIVRLSEVAEPDGANERRSCEHNNCTVLSESAASVQILGSDMHGT